MSSISRTKPEFAEPAAKNAKLAQSPQLPALPAIPQETDFSELTVSEDLPASVFQVTSPLLMDHVSNPTVTPILSALNASKDLSFAFNVLPPRTESSSSPKASAFVWTASMPMPATNVFLVEMDAESAHQPPTVQLALPWQLPAETESAHAHKGPSSLSQPTVLDTALLADLTATFVLMPAPALLA
jgi:hypothetical protein